MKQINLLEIWEEVLTRPDGPYESKDFDILYPYKELIVAAMKEAVKNTLELAAENAFLETTETMQGCPECGVIGVDKQSILNIINQVI